MINENEVVLLLLCIGVLIFTINKRREYKRIPGWRLLLAAFCIFSAGVVCTVVEGFIWADLLNILEHLLYACSSFVLLIWCQAAFQNDKGGV